MFKKKPNIKNLSPLRSSDRRKLADQIIADYSVTVPSGPTTDTEGTASTGPTLTSLRSSLLPDNLQSARFTTHAGSDATLVSGTIYVGAHAGHEERILWIQHGKETRLYPTVYTLWQNPGLVPLLHTPDFVIEKLQTGADLMTPGLIGGPPWPERAKKGSVVAVAGLQRDTVPVWVGICNIDISALGRVQGMKGAAVQGIHWNGDELWNWSHTGNGGRAAPDAVEGSGGAATSLSRGVESLGVDDNGVDQDDEDKEDEDAAQEGGGVSLTASEVNGHGDHKDAVDPDSNVDESSHEPTTTEIDAAFHEAFLYAVFKARNSGRSKPRYGIDLPVQPSALWSAMIQPNLRHQSPHYNIKKTSWKTWKKFIKQLDKEALLKSKDRNGGETVILDIDFDDQQVTNFMPYELPEAKAPSTSTRPAPSMEDDVQALSDTRIVTLYRPSPKLYPDLFSSKTGFYSHTQVTNAVKTYITANPELTQCTSSPRYIKLDPFISNIILNGSSPQDNAILAAGEIARDTLARRLISDTILLSPYWVLLPPSAAKQYDHLDPAATLSALNLKPKPYPMPSILIVLEKRTGTKTVTRISGFEFFGLNPQTLGPELQKKCAGSASVGQLMGGKPGTMEITVQGEQTEIVKSELFKRGVKTEWITVDDKVNKKKKPAGGTQPAKGKR